VSLPEEILIGSKGGTQISSVNIMDKRGAPVCEVSKKSSKQKNRGKGGGEEIEDKALLATLGTRPGSRGVTIHLEEGGGGDHPLLTIEGPPRLHAARC